MNQNEIKAQISNYLQDELGLEVDESAGEDSQANLEIDSLEIVKLIAFIEEEMSVNIPAFGVSVDDFKTVDSIANLVSRLG